MKFKELSEEEIRGKLRAFYDEEFLTAHLSKFKLPDEPLEKIFNWYRNPAHIFFFAGNTGLGKTYLGAAMAREWVQRRYSWRRYTEKRLFSELRLSMEKTDYRHELARLCDTDFFILDDLGVTRADREKINPNYTPFQADVISDFLDMRWESKKPTLVTSNLFLSNINEHFGPRFSSRLNDTRNLILEINWIDKRVEEF